MQGILGQEARTENDMKAFRSTEDAVTDLFFKVGASRGKDIVPQFSAAYEQESDLALRVLLWARDARQGAGEREIFRQVLRYLERTHPNDVARLMHKIPELGRWDDLLIFTNPSLKHKAFRKIQDALLAGNGLCAKWMPRKGKVAAELRNQLGWTPKFYRKRLVELTDVVEQKMCANKWNEIDFEKVPSVAAARYKRAFSRHDIDAFTEYVEKVKSGEAKVNAGAVYPYDVLKGVANYRWSMNYNAVELDHIRAQWEALPNYLGDQKVLAMIDVSASMNARVSGGNVTCMDVAVSLGLYVADKNTGPFKDAFLTFSGRPELQIARGDILAKAVQVSKAHWDMNTNVIAAFEKILEVATRNRVPESDMPDTMLILSDMQFDRCARFDDSALQSIRRQYKQAGYSVPNIVFWNLNSYDNVPAKFNSSGVALVSGFSPTIMKAVLSANLEEFTPRNIMLKTIMNDRYSLPEAYYG